MHAESMDPSRPLRPLRQLNGDQEFRTGLPVDYYIQSSTTKTTPFP